MDIKKISDKIADEILTVYGHNDTIIKCTRAQLMLRRPDGSESDMGGRNKESISMTIEEQLRIEEKKL